MNVLYTLSTVLPSITRTTRTTLYLKSQRIPLVTAQEYQKPQVSVVKPKRLPVWVVSPKVSRPRKLADAEYWQKSGRGQKSVSMTLYFVRGLLEGPRIPLVAADRERVKVFAFCNINPGYRVFGINGRQCILTYV